MNKINKRISQGLYRPVIHIVYTSKTRTKKNRPEEEQVKARDHSKSRKELDKTWKLLSLC